MSTGTTRWARPRAWRRNATRRATRAKAQSRGNVSRYVNASSVFRAHSSPPDSNDSIISHTCACVGEAPDRRRSAKARSASALRRARQYAESNAACARGGIARTRSSSPTRAAMSLFNFCAARISSRSHAATRASTNGATRSRRSRSRNASSRADFSSAVSAVPRAVVDDEEGERDVAATSSSSSSRGRTTRRLARATRGFVPRASSDVPDARVARAPRDRPRDEVDARADAWIRATSPSMRDDDDEAANVERRRFGFSVVVQASKRAGSKSYILRCLASLSVACARWMDVNFSAARHASAGSARVHLSGCHTAASLR